MLSWTHRDPDVGFHLGQFVPYAPAQGPYSVLTGAVEVRVLVLRNHMANQATSTEHHSKT